MNKGFSLFIKILVILMIFTILLPYLVDSVIDFFIIENNESAPKGNSTFVASSDFIHKFSFLQNFYLLIKNYLF